MRTIRQRYNYIVKRIWNPNIYDYPYNFKKAISNSIKLDIFEKEDFKENNFNIEDKDKQYISNFILRGIYDKQNLEIDDIALKCYYVNYKLKLYLKSNFNLNSYLTTGNVYCNKLRVNYEKFSTLKERIKNPNYDKPINFHTWLTLENYDVIDLVLYPNMWLEEYFSKYSHNPHDYQKICWFSPINIDIKNAEYIFVPKIIGEKYFYKIGIPL